MTQTRDPSTGQIFNDGVAPISVQSTPYGTYPQNNVQPININTTQAALWSLTGAQNYHSMYFEITAATGETLTVNALSDGGVTLSPIWVHHLDGGTPLTPVEATGLGVGVYQYFGTMNVAGLLWTKSAGAALMTIRGQISGA